MLDSLPSNNFLAGLLGQYLYPVNCHHLRQTLATRVANDDELSNVFILFFIFSFVYYKPHKPSYSCNLSCLTSSKVKFFPTPHCHPSLKCKLVIFVFLTYYSF